MNRTVVASLGLFLLAGLPLQAPAAPLTDREQFEKQVGKSAHTDAFVVPKHLCVCIEDDTAADEHKVGYVALANPGIGTDGLLRIQVVCFVPRFFASGGNAGLMANSSACSGVWVPLHK
jgi:hypothetical protein